MITKVRIQTVGGYEYAYSDSPFLQGEFSLWSACRVINGKVEKAGRYLGCYSAYDVTVLGRMIIWDGELQLANSSAIIHMHMPENNNVKENKIMRDGEDMTKNVSAREIRNLNNLKEDDLVLLEAGIVDETGALTDNGKAIVLDKVFANVKTEIVADVKKINKARKDAK